jgi:beta-1,4-mannosyl-glycoprotein beta-1,4-N-acetylglucosaminyltransferase
MKIIDSFIFYNELELLYYRLSILDPLVDYVILVESTHTFSGHVKPLYYAENQWTDRFSKFNSKIIHIVTEPLYKFPDINYNCNQQWQNEYCQRNAIKIGVDRLKSKLADDDIILTSDVDEIPNPTVLDNARNGTLQFDKRMLNRLALDMYYYNLCCRVGDGSNWHGVKLMTYYAYNNIGLSFQQMRVHEHTNAVPVIPRGGWHLSYFGDLSFIVKKIQGYSHQEYNNDTYLNREELEKKISGAINLLNNTELQYIDIENNNNLPYKYEIYLKSFIGPKKSTTYSVL